MAPRLPGLPEVKALDVIKLAAADDATGSSLPAQKPVPGLSALGSALLLGLLDALGWRCARLR